MAIDPSAEYPGQIITGLPGYPLGKAVNVAVSGDGTGTPLEAKWVSDLFGWEQALLDAAGITPSGDPDAVGASDYMDALDALYPAIGRMTTAESDITALEASRVTGPASATDEAFARFDLTTGKLLQDGVVKATNAGAVTGVTDLTLSGEVLYATPKSITRPICLTSARPQESTATGWAFGVFADIGWSHPAASPVGSLVLELAVRPGMTITGVRVRVDPSAIRAGANRIRVDLWSRAFAASSASIASAFDNGTAAAQTIALSTSTAVTAGTRYFVTVLPGTGGSGDDLLIDASITVTDEGPRS